MAGNIKGIIVEIGGDTSGLQNALKKVNSATASLSKELKGINTLLKLNPKNTELLAQKQTVLRNNIAETSKKLEQLKNIQQKFIQSGGDVNSAAYRNLQREIIKTEQELQKLKIEASSWTKVSDALGKVENNMKKWGKTIESIGNQLTTKLTLPILGLGAAATKASIDFESAFAGVEKTVDGTELQMASLKQGIRDMAKEIPASTTEISAVAEAAGQLGVKTDDILDFTRVMIDLGNSTNLSAEEAASSLAKLANIVGMPAQHYERLGSTIVALGNNFATTEKDIVEMSTRLAATGDLAGLGTHQILSLATAMSSVGIEAEAGGSAMSKLLKKIQVATEVGGDDLEQFAKVAGVSAEEFTREFGNDAVQALTMFLKGLNDTERNGKSAIAILDEMDMNEVRLSNTILSLAGSGDLLTNAVELGNKAWEENNALATEAEKRYATTKSQIQILKNKLSDLGITIGDIILPYVVKAVDFLGQLADKFSKLSPNIQKTIVKIAGITAAIGPALSILGKLMGVGGKIFGGLSKLTGIISKVSAGAKGLSGIIGALASPIGIVVAAIAALVAAFVYFFNTNEEFRNKVMSVWQGICDMFQNQVKPIFEQLWGTIQTIIGQIVQIFQQLWTNLEPIIMGMLTWLMDFWENTLKDIVMGVIEFVGKLWQFQAEIYSKFILPIVQFLMEKLWPIVEWVIKNVIERTQDVLQHIGNIIKNIIGVFKGIIDFITGVFTGDWQKAWEGVQTIFSNLMGGLWEIIKWPLNQIIKGVNKMIDGLNNIKVPDWVPGIGGKSMNIPHIPELAKGGIISKPTIAMVGEGKSAEAVIPLDKTLVNYMAEAMRMAGGERNIVVNFYPQKMTDEELDRCFNYVDRRYGMEY